MDRWLKDKFPSLTSRQIQEALDSGLVRLAGKKARKGDKLGSEVVPDVGSLEAHLEKLRKGNSTLEVPIVSENEDYLIVDKPAGLPGHPLSLFDVETVTHWCLAQRPEVAQAFPEIQPTLTPHRLDTGTSGLLIVAKTKKAFELWRERFKRKEVTKVYRAWCWGAPSEAHYEVTAAIGHDPTDSRKMTVITSPHREPVMAANSQVRVGIRRADRGLFLAEVTCTTGITHQVRVHLASLGFPLLGDALYDPDFPSRSESAPHHQLRAVRLACGADTFELDSTEFEKRF